MTGADPMRVVSLVPSSTETLLALGVDVIACTRFCEQPGIPHVGGTKNPDIDAIVGLQPDLVVLDREENRREDAELLGRAGLDLFVSDVRSLASGIAVMGDLAQRASVEAPPPIELPTPSDRPVTAFVPIWRRPWMTITSATYGGSLLAHLGVDCDVAAPPSAHPYPVLELEEVAELAPDLVLVPSEPYDFDEHHVDELRASLPQSDVIRLDGRDLFWWGSRSPGAIDRLDAVLRHSRSRFLGDRPPRV
jgi:ABC-type Fe3+-hydroxamate transport system substrate-binding protein